MISFYYVNVDHGNINIDANETEIIFSSQTIFLAYLTLGFLTSHF